MMVDYFEGAHLMWTFFYYWIYLTFWTLLITLLGHTYLLIFEWGIPWWLTPYGWYHKARWKTRYLWDKPYRTFKQGCKRYDLKKEEAFTKFANKYGGTVVKTGKY